MPNHLPVLVTPRHLENMCLTHGMVLCALISHAGSDSTCFSLGHFKESPKCSNSYYPYVFSARWSEYKPRKGSLKSWPIVKMWKHSSEIRATSRREVIALQCIYTICVICIYIYIYIHIYNIYVYI